MTITSYYKKVTNDLFYRDVFQLRQYAKFFVSVLLGWTLFPTNLAGEAIRQHLEMLWYLFLLSPLIWTAFTVYNDLETPNSNYFSLLLKKETMMTFLIICGSYALYYCIALLMIIAGLDATALGLIVQLMYCAIIAVCIVFVIQKLNRYQKRLHFFHLFSLLALIRLSAIGVSPVIQGVLSNLDSLSYGLASVLFYTCLNIVLIKTTVIAGIVQARITRAA